MVTANARYRELTGVDAAAADRISIYDAFPNALADLTEQIDSALRGAMPPGPVRIPFQQRDRRRLIETTFVPLTDESGGRGLLFAGNDVTEREELRETLSRSVAQLESIFDVIPDSVRVFDSEGVWAAGDCVESLDRISGNRVHVALGTHANKQGRVLGTNLGGGYATFSGVVGTAVSKVCELEIARTGLREADCDAVGFRWLAVTVDSTTRAGYYPDAAPITVKLVVEQRTGRLLGGQIVGREGAAKRVDILAVALWNRMTVEEIALLDLGYAPPFSPVWDPVLIAARKAADAVRTG